MVMEPQIPLMLALKMSGTPLMAQTYGLQIPHNGQIAMVMAMAITQVTMLLILISFQIMKQQQMIVIAMASRITGLRYGMAVIMMA